MPAYVAVFRDLHPDVAIIGSGAVGRALALRLNERGYPVRAIVSRSLENAMAVRDEVRGAKQAAREDGIDRGDERPSQGLIASDNVSDVPDIARLVLVCVPDEALSGVVERLARVPHMWERTIVAHTSGAQPAAVLKPLAEKGARILAFHPLQTLSQDSPPEALDSVYVGLEGQAQAVAAGIELAVNLGLRYVVLSADAKARYHLAASMASNFMVTLISVVQQVLNSLDIDRTAAQEMIEPLVRGTLDNLNRSTPEDALTGPIVRGDLETIRQHGLAMRRHLPHLVPLYAALAAETIPLAIRSSKLDPDRAQEILDLLEKMVTLPLPVPVS